MAIRPLRSATGAHQEDMNVLIANLKADPRAAALVADAAGLFLDPRVRILRAPQRQGPNRRQLIQVRRPGEGNQAARKVGKES